MWSAAKYLLLNLACSRGLVSLSVFSSFSRILLMLYSRHIGLSFVRSFLFPFLKSIRLSDNNLMYSLTSVFEVVSSPAFNISMFIWSLAVSVPFHISLRAASISQDVVSDIPFRSTWIMILCPMSYSSV